MNPKIGMAAIVLALATLSFAGPYTMAHVARASGGESADASCTSISPCLLESNSSSGAGVKGASTMGNGVIGQTSAVGKNSATGRSAVLGQDEQTSGGDGLFNFGVTGTSKNGTGVEGSGGSAGVSGIATSLTGVGVLASTTAGGLLFEGSGQGVGNGLPSFTLNASGQAVFGVTTAGDGKGNVTVHQKCGSSTPMFEGDDESGLEFSVDSCGNVVTNRQLSTSNVLGTDSIESYTGAPIEVLGQLDADFTFSSTDPRGSGTNYTATDSSGVTWLYQGYSTTAGKYTVEMGDSGSIYARTFITMVEPRVAQQTSTGSRVDTYTPQITEPSIEDFGEAQLRDGVVSVSLDPRFAAVIDSSTRYFVTLTPEGDCRGLYVAQRGTGGFVVRELQGGRSSISFTYRIVARPLGADTSRLPMSTLPYEFEHKVPSPTTFRRAPHATVPNAQTRPQ